MALHINELLQRPEGEDFEKKRALDPTSAQEYLDLVADLVAMANTQGGSILIGTRGAPIPVSHRPRFDSARIDDKVNSLVEPRAGGIRSCLVDDDFIFVEIEKSPNPPHVFKHDGTYMNQQERNAFVFRKGDLFARHSSKSERANRADFDRWFDERQQRLLENVKLVFEASPQAQIQITEGPRAVPVRIDSHDPGAQPVYDLLTPDPFRDLQQELTGALKAWKTSHQLLNEAQIYKAYGERNQISDPAILELLLRSSWERYVQGYCWAAKLDGGTLLRLLEEVLKTDPYPSSQEALKIAALLPRGHAKALFRLVEGSKRKSVKKAAKKLDPVLRARARKYEALIKVLCPIRNLTYLAGEGTKEVKIQAVNESTFEELLRSLLEGKKENKAPFKAAELLMYGRPVTLVDLSALAVPAEELIEEAGSAGTQSESGSSNSE